MKDQTTPAFLQESLYAKSKVYAGRAFRAKQAGDADEYQLWASLALELLGKAALAKISPALVADPTHHESLFASCGVRIGTDFKTISAKTLFLRLPHICKSFDPHVKSFCEQVALQRNAELHSGEAPFLSTVPERWDQKYWYAISIVLEAQGRTLEEWLGAEESTAPKQVLESAEHAISRAVKERIERARLAFERLYANPARREAVIKESRRIRAWDHYKDFSENFDSFETHACPACTSTGIVGGPMWDELVIEEEDPEDPTVELVERTYLTEEFRCLTCDLVLEGRREILAAGVFEEFREIRERERVFEPEYGND